MLADNVGVFVIFLPYHRPLPQLQHELDTLVKEEKKDIGGERRYTGSKQASNTEHTEDTEHAQYTNQVEDLDRSAIVQAAYFRVLHLLRAADSSGLWPLSSIARQKVMVKSAEVVEQGCVGR